MSSGDTYRRGRERFYLGLYVYEHDPAPELSAPLVLSGVRGGLGSLAPADVEGEAEDATLESWGHAFGVEAGDLKELERAQSGDVEAEVYAALMARLPGLFVALHRHHRRRGWSSLSGRRVRVALGALGVVLLLGLGAYGLAAYLRRPACDLEATFFGDTSLGTEIAQAKVCAVDADWGMGAPFDDGPVDRFSVRWRGTLQVPRAGHYTFVMEADDGARVFIDGELVLEDWSVHATRRTEGAAQLGPGPHRIRVEYFDEAELAFVRLSWFAEHMSERVISARHLGSP